jgi:hypothetical protein
MPNDTSKRDYDAMAVAIVSEDAAKSNPYPYVLVTEQGAVHELDAEDRSFLETRFHPFDSGRPYVKSKYTDRNGWGNLRGFCLRSAIPQGIAIASEPVHRDPPKPIVETLRELAEKTGRTFKEQPNGTYVSRRREVKKWWQFWR